MVQHMTQLFGVSFREKVFQLLINAHYFSPYNTGNHIGGVNILPQIQ
jgi:hypothetical protein